MALELASPGFEFHTADHVARARCTRDVRRHPGLQAHGRGVSRGKFHPAFGIKQKVSANNYPFARLEAFRNDHLIHFPGTNHD